MKKRSTCRSYFSPISRTVKKLPRDFAHLPVVNVQECVVQPVAGKGHCPLQAFALGNLVLMMREDQILSAGMNIDLLTQIFFGHDGALNVPAGTAVAPGRRPGGLALFLRFPENEIQGIFLLILTGSREENGRRLCRSSRFLWESFPYSAEFAGAEINGAVYHRRHSPFPSDVEIISTIPPISSVAYGMGGRRV